jgi:membrane associated rhomboid family serine protease
MADEHDDLALDRLLGQREALPGDDFVLGVMHRVQGERRRRRLILSAFGAAGALFGLLGAYQLAGPIALLFAELPTTALMQVVLLAGAGAAFYTWFMNDDMGLTG